MPCSSPATLLARILIVALAILYPGLPAAADTRPAGVVLDYQPRAMKSGKPAIYILRAGKRYPVREHEILYSGDTFEFEPVGDTTPSVTALIDADTKVTISPDKPKLPDKSWAGLEQLLPRLMSAYRWINSSGAGASEGPRNAVSRGDDEEMPLSALPRTHGRLALSGSTQMPLWIGWTGGKPPFKVATLASGKTLGEVDVCADAAVACVREATVPASVEGPITLQISTAENKSWSVVLERRDTMSASGSIAAAAGDLGQFLAAIDLLDEGRGEMVLESARILAAMQSRYPPARAVLDHIRDGVIP
jgi:hypothetical protein